MTCFRSILLSFLLSFGHSFLSSVLGIILSLLSSVLLFLPPAYPCLPPVPSIPIFLSLTHHLLPLQFHFNHVAIIAFVQTCRTNPHLARLCFVFQQQQLQVPVPGTNGPAMIPQGSGPTGAPVPGGKRGRDGVPKETAASRKSAAAAAAAGELYYVK